MPVLEGVVAWTFAGAVGVGAFKARVIAAQNQTIAARELLAEAGGGHAQIGLFDIGYAEAGEAGDFRRDGVEPGRRQVVPLRQRFGVLAAGEDSGGLDEVLFGALVGDLLEIPGRCRIGGQVSHVLIENAGGAVEVVQHT